MYFCSCCKSDRKTPLLKLLISFLFIFSLNVHGAETFHCFRQNFELSIVVNQIENFKNVQWVLRLNGNDLARIEGRGVWRKEDDSLDAFSSFDDNSAISYKEKRAVFVLPNNQAIYFPLCEMIDLGNK